jgi:mannose-6-phosphate isomerase-like protein (cupin superfamily)
MPSGCEIHVARIRCGGTSSWHYHDKLVNMFYVIQGRLTIEFGENHSRVTLSDGDTITMETGVPHKFIAELDTILLEGYAQVDIQRRQTF